MSLQDDPLIQQFKYDVNQRIADLVYNISKGSMTPDSYKKSCGEVEGLKTALELLDEAIKAYTTGDDEDSMDN